MTGLVTNLPPGYHRAQHIGSGGWAEVYRCVDAATGETVALKLFHQRLEDPVDGAAQFRQECRTAAMLSAHPGVVKVRAAGVTAAASPWLAMDLATGGTLVKAIRDAGGQLPLDRALDITTRLADTLAWAHTLGSPIIHGDIKAANVLLDDAGRPLLSDFGVATHLGSRHSVTVAQFTHTHAAPEVLDDGRVSVSSDVWALTITLFEMLTGSPPFVVRDGEGPGAFIKRVEQGLPSDAIPESVPEPVAAVIRAGLLVDRKQRTASMAALAASLRAAQEALGMPVTPPWPVAAGPGTGDLRFIGHTEALAIIKQRRPPAIEQMQPAAPARHAAAAPAATASAATSGVAPPAAPSARHAAAPLTAPLPVVAPPIAPPPIALPPISSPPISSPPISSPPIEVFTAPAPEPDGPRRRRWPVAVAAAVVVAAIAAGVAFAIDRVGNPTATGSSPTPGLSSAPPSTPDPSPVLVLPGTVTAFTVRDNTGGGTGLDARLAFTVTPPTGLPAITKYDFEYTGDQLPDFSSATATGFITGLVNGTQYVVRVRACAESVCGHWSAAGPARRPYGPAPQPVVAASKQGAQQVNLTWSPPAHNGRPLAKIEIRVNGGGWEDVGLAAGNRVVGNGFNQTHTIEARATDAAGQVSKIATASAGTNAPQVQVGRGSSAQGQTGCSVSTCRYITVTLTDFAPNTTYNCSFSANPAANPALGNRNLTTDGSGDYNGQTTNYYGVANGSVTVTCAGISGTRNNWGN